MIELDFYDDENLFPQLTKKNAAILNQICTTIDSSYRRSFNASTQGSSANLIRNAGKDWTDNPITVESICKAIDRENSTHLSVSGMEKGRDKNDPGNPNNKGIEQMVAFIVSYKNRHNGCSILEKINEGDPCLVDEMASSVIDIPKYKCKDELLDHINNYSSVEGCEIISNHLTNGESFISKYSFASKFCTYVTRNDTANVTSNDRDDLYAIYDNVVRSILPYYIFKVGSEDNPESFIKESVIKGRIIKQSTIECTQEGFRYCDYRNLITNLQKRLEDNVSLKDIDMILWYYYKGDNELIADALGQIK